MAGVDYQSHHVSIIEVFGVVSQVPVRCWVLPSEATASSPDGNKKVLGTPPVGHTEATSGREEQLFRRIPLMPAGCIVADQLPHVIHEVLAISEPLVLFELTGKRQREFSPDGAVHVDACRDGRVLQSADVSRWEVEEKSATEMAGEEGQRLRVVVLQVADQVEETLVLQPHQVR